MLEPGPPGLQLYPVPPVTLNVVELPEQMVVDGDAPILSEGAVEGVMVHTAWYVAPQPTLMLQVYVPDARPVAVWLVPPAGLHE